MYTYVGKVHRNAKAYGDTPHPHPHPQIFLSSLSDYSTNMISVKDGYFDNQIAVSVTSTIIL